MYVADLRILRFRHLRDIHIGPLSAPKSSEAIVLAGPNGSGKSSILELLAYALSRWGFNWNMRRSFPESAFEIAFEVTEDDVAAIRARVSSTPALDSSGVLERLAAVRRFYAAFNYPGGEYDHDPEYNARALDLVQNALRDRIKAVFLRSDRYYPQRNYDRNQYWTHQQRSTNDYLRSMSFTLTERQYQDQMDFLVEQAYVYPRTVGVHTIAAEEGQEVGPRPQDPLAPYQDLFQRLFPDYSFAKPSDDLRDQLYVRLPGDVEVPFSDLSSGEQETFFLLTFLVRHDVTDSMVFIDEPELHLHPELVRRLVRLLLAVRPGNQIWLATHNAELIDEAGRDRTYFINRPTPAEPATAIRASDEGEALSLIRSLFGMTGYIGLARRMVFLEGDAASADRRVFVQLFPDISDKVRFIPVNSADNALRINRAALSLLDTAVGGTEFFLIRDRDYLIEDQIRGYTDRAGDKLVILQRHEIENYLIQADAIAEVLDELVGVRLSPQEVDLRLAEIARRQAGRVLRDGVASQLNARFRPRDCSIGGFEANAEWLDASMAWNQGILGDATARFQAKVASEVEDLRSTTSNESVADVLTTAAAQIVADLQSGAWKSSFPGKELLDTFATELGLGSGTVLRNALIRNLAAHQGRIDQELVQIIARIAT